MHKLEDLGHRGGGTWDDHDEIAGKAMGARPTRAAVLLPFYKRLAAGMGIRADAATRIAVDSPDFQVPHAMLRRTLQSDPAMAALLPVAPGRMVLGKTYHGPFFLKRSGLLLLPPTLLSDSSALAVAARWGLEASHLQANGLLGPAAASIVVEHGIGLLRALPLSSRELLLENIPEQLRPELLTSEQRPVSEALVAWQASRIEGLQQQEPAVRTADVGPPIELWGPLESILVAGGDSRLELNPRNGFNRYGATARPRPEAVHFSSSTASSISDYGFMFCDMLRRDLIADALRAGTSATGLRSRASDAIGAAIADLLALKNDEADVILAPSGTDTELLSVMVALSAGRPLLNILLAPDETGRGVSAAGRALYFDGVAATGAMIKKGQPVWPSAAPDVVEVPIRDERSSPRPIKEIVGELRGLAAAAVAEGKHVLLHLLATSKTGISVPPEQAWAAIAGLDQDDIDVVVDACQMRTRFDRIGSWVRGGCMVQVSGSKFLTGPPFSGALLLPPTFRARAKPIARFLAAAPGVGHSEDWNPWWRDQLKRTPSVIWPSFGTVFRWLPALLEAKLLKDISPDLMRYAFDRFRAGLKDHLDQSKWLVPIDEGNIAPEVAVSGLPDLATASIICFAVTVADWQGQHRVLDEYECRLMFQLLNTDLSRNLGRLSPADEERARQQAHIGQPVLLKGLSGGRESVLRLVVGARFFTFIGHAGPGSLEAALESEIGDAIRALEKLEMLAERWADISTAQTGRVGRRIQAEENSQF